MNRITLNYQEEKKNRTKKIVFIDLFCGIGAFHETITKLFPDADCRWAIDSSERKKKMYKSLFPSFPEERFLCKDIEKEEVVKKLTSAEEDYDWLCAGFPCQPYSRAGEKKGVDHSSGNCFNKMMEIVELYNNNHPNNELRILMLENVDYLVKHNEGRTWDKMKKKIKKLNYAFPEFYSFVDSESNLTYLSSKNLIINPLDLVKIPLNRPRLFLMAFHKNFFAKKLKEKKIIVSKNAGKNSLSIYKEKWLQSINEIEIVSLGIEEEKKKVLDIWTELLNKISYYDLPRPLWLEFFFLVPRSNKKGIGSFLKKFCKRHGPDKLLELLTNKEELKKHEIFTWNIRKRSIIDEKSIKKYWERKKLIANLNLILKTIT